jgi:hypothetical protein
MPNITYTQRQLERAKRRHTCTQREREGETEGRDTERSGDTNAYRSVRQSMYIEGEGEREREREREREKYIYSSHLGHDERGR